MKSELNRSALIIAGSDPSGGAGIQADIKTFTAVGVYCGAVITSVTCQNTTGVSYFSPLSPTLVKDQIESVLTDLNISHIKIGMLGSAGIVRGVKEILADFTGEIIFDPVMAAGSGDPLYNKQEEEGSRGIREVIELATIITPNLDELAAISGLPCPDSRRACEAAGVVLEQYPRLRAVCLTGGHLEEDPGLMTDFLIKSPLRMEAGEKPEVISRSHNHVKTPNLHGTGCTFASAYCAYHLLTGEDREAFQLATGFTARLIKKSTEYRIGHGNGPLLHFLRYKWINKSF